MLIEFCMTQSLYSGFLDSSSKLAYNYIDNTGTTAIINTLHFPN